MQALSLSNAVSGINYIFTDVKSVFQLKSRYVERSLRVRFFFFFFMADRDSSHRKMVKGKICVSERN